MKCTKCGNCSYASKKKAKQVRNPIWQILKDMNAALKENGYPKIDQFKTIGSAKRNMVYQRGNSEFDTDIQMIYIDPKKTKNLHANIKHYINEALNKVIPIGWTTSISTSAIYVKGIEQNQNFDLAVIKETEIGQEISRGKNLDNNSNDSYKWNILPSSIDAYETFRNADKNDVLNIKQIYLNKKCDHFDKSEEDASKKSSSNLFVDSVNDYYKR